MQPQLDCLQADPYDPDTERSLYLRSEEGWVEDDVTLGSGRPILVVEDDPSLGKVIELILTDAGYKVVSASDGRDALDKIALEMPGVVLLDMKMPVMDGWEFAGELRTRYGRSVPIIMVTAAWNSQQRAEEIGADDYLDKPFDIDELVRVVERHYIRG